MYSHKQLDSCGHGFALSSWGSDERSQLCHSRFGRSVWIYLLWPSPGLAGRTCQSSCRPQRPTCQASCQAAFYNAKPLPCMPDELQIWPFVSAGASTGSTASPAASWRGFHGDWALRVHQPQNCAAVRLQRVQPAPAPALGSILADLRLDAEQQEHAGLAGSMGLMISCPQRKP